MYSNLKDHLNRTLLDYQNALASVYFETPKQGSSLVCVVSTESKHPALDLCFKYGLMDLNSRIKPKGEMIFQYRDIQVYFLNGNTQKIYMTKVPYQ